VTTSPRARAAVCTGRARAGVLTLGAALTLLGTTVAHADDPSGRNGVVKIVGHGDIDRIPENNPHQGCTLGIEWYGYDEGDIVSTVEFELWDPTSGSLAYDGAAETQIGEDAASGGRDLDATEWYTFTVTDGEAHDVQGFHLKITVHAPGSRGDETKSKVIWFQDCEIVQPEPEPETEPSPVAEPSDGSTPVVVVGSGDAVPAGEASSDTETTGITIVDAGAVPEDSDEETPEVVETEGSHDVSGGQAVRDGVVPIAVDAGLDGSSEAHRGAPGRLLAVLGGLLAGMGVVLALGGRRRAARLR
jgi:hypothetical protein